MKRLFALTMVLVFVVGIPFSVLANDGEYRNVSQFCTANDDLGYSSHGQCVSYLRACYGPGNSGPMCVCRDYLNSDPQGFYDMYNNLRACISHLRHGYVP